MYISPQQERRSNTCTSGLQWWVCRSNNFSGCCSVDPCDLPTCPDSDSDSAAAASSTSTSSTASATAIAVSPHTASTSVVTAIVSATVTSSTTAAATTSLTTLQTSSARTTAKASSTAATSSSSSPESTSSALPSTASHGTNSSKTATIAGSIGGVLGMVLLGFLLYIFCFRPQRRASQRQREKWTREARGGTVSVFGADGKEITPSNTTKSSDSYREDRGGGRGVGDIFAAFGGRFRSLRSGGRGYEGGEKQVLNGGGEGGVVPTAEVLHPPCLVPGSSQHTTADTVDGYNQDPVPNLDSRPVLPQNELDASPSPCAAKAERLELSAEPLHKGTTQRQEKSSPKCYKPAKQHGRTTSCMRANLNHYSPDQEQGHVLSWQNYDSSPHPSPNASTRYGKGSASTSQEVSPMIPGERWSSGQSSVSPETSPEIGVVKKGGASAWREKARTAERIDE